jgi:hypothetical protein
MKEKDLLKIKDAFWFNEHELNDDQLEQLIENKFIRAREYYEALTKREERVSKKLD